MDMFHFQNKRRTLGSKIALKNALLLSNNTENLNQTVEKKQK